MKFESQICTTREQSERLLALGLKKETADMSHTAIVVNHKVEYRIDCSTAKSIDIPAWSLHRLVEMMPRYVHTDYYHYERTLFADSICYYKELYNDCGEDLISFDSPNLYDRVINCIEWLIKECYFNKEYLV